jgi:hypothetical protein
MATHNAEDGTGGLDASIVFTEEQIRPEVGVHSYLRAVKLVLSGHRTLGMASITHCKLSLVSQVAS